MPRRLYVPPGSIDQPELTLTGKSHHYLVRVLRLRPGTELVLFDGEGLEADAVLHALADGRAVLRLLGPARTATPPDCAIAVAFALIKGDRTDACIQKLVELGVATIAPLITERTVVRLDGARADKRQRRFVDIARAAARQCGRTNVPEIAPIAALPAFLDARAPGDLELILCASAASGGSGSGEVATLGQRLPQHPPSRTWVLVGPEGGFSPREVALAGSHGFSPTSLGRYVLRADTAVLAVVSALKYAFDEVAS